MTINTTLKQGTEHFLLWFITM